MSSYSWTKLITALKRQTYTTLKQDDNHSSRCSDKTPLEECVQATERHQAGRWLRISLLINVVLLLSILTLGILFDLPKRPVRLLKSPLPDFPEEVRTFEMNSLFLSLPTDESNRAWDNLHGPNGRGFVNLDPNDPGFDYPDTRAGLSVFHQLHCLGALRHFMWDLVHDRVDTKKMLSEWPRNTTQPSYEDAVHGLWHYAHCFDYLRQALTCSADVSLEFVSSDTGVAVVDGLDWPHVCKSWDAIWEYAETYG